VRDAPPISLYEIWFHFKALLWESIILLLPPPTCNAYSIAIRVHNVCAIYDPPPTPLVYAIHDTILVMTISCKGQAPPYVGNARSEGNSTRLFRVGLFAEGGHRVAASTPPPSTQIYSRELPLGVQSHSHSRISSLCVCARVPFVYKPCVNTITLRMYAFVSYPGYTRRNMRIRIP